MAVARTSITVDKALVRRIKKVASGNGRGWTIEIVFLAETALNQIEAKAKEQAQ